MKLLEPCLGNRFFAYFVKIIVQTVEKKGVDNLVYVFYRGVMHASLAPCVGVERRLKHTAKDGG